MTRSTFVIALLLVGCAEGGIAPGTNNDTSNANNMTDVTQNNVNNAPDVESNCNLCCPGEARCTSETQREVCRESGNSFETTDCAEGEMCTDGVCGVPQVCEPGAKSCQDAMTLLTCRANGTAYSAETCDAGTACTGGRCASGFADGASCANNGECASGVCHCGAEENCAGIAQGYCATKDCTAGSCGPTAICVDSARAPFGDPNVDYAHCVPRCDGTCPTAPFLCSQLPVTESAEDWASGCYFPEVAAIGGDCSNDTRCLGGLCRSDYFTQSNFCTRDCSADGQCPPGSACAELESNVFQCTLLCGDGSVVGQDPCPLDLPDDRFDVTCRNLNVLPSGAKRVCATP